MFHLMLVMIGGGLGAGSRHLVGLWTLRQFGPGFPFGTLIVNVLGSLLMGLFIGWMVRGGGNENLRFIVATGFLGGFTTFSAFSLDFLNLWRSGDQYHALGYVVVSVVLSLAAVALGLALMRQA